jgi:hypothetical protein
MNTLQQAAPKQHEHRCWQGSIRESAKNAKMGGLIRQTKAFFRAFRMFHRSGKCAV